MLYLENDCEPCVFDRGYDLVYDEEDVDTGGSKKSKKKKKHKDNRHDDSDDDEYKHSKHVRKYVYLLN